MTIKTILTHMAAILGLAASFNVYAIEINTKIPLDAVTLADERLDGCLDNLAIESGWETTSDVTGLYCSGVDSLSGMEVLNQLEEVAINLGYTFDLSPLHFAKELKKLTLEDMIVRDVSPLSTLHKLEYLNLGGNPLTDVGPIGALKNLKKLYLFEAKIEDISALSELKNLTFLDVNFNRIHTVGSLEQLENLEALQMISAFASHADLDILISSIGKLEKLTSLSLSGNNLNNLSALDNLKQLEFADFSANQLQDLSFLQDKSILTKLFLDNNVIDNWDYLTQLSSLEVLSLRGNQLTTIPDVVIQAFEQNMPALKEMNLSNNFNANCNDVEKLVTTLPHVLIVIPNHCQI